MKIAQIAPLIESVPPRFYGGTERIVSYLAEELVRLGHDVTLFASGDSVTSARLVSCTRTALRLDRNVRDPIPYYMLMLDQSANVPTSSTFCTSTSTNSTFRCFGRLRPHPDDAARPAGSAGLAATLCRLQRDAVGLDLRRSAGAHT